MKEQVSGKKLRVLAGQVGDFIRYWGFRRIHGEIWTAVYLSETPLSGAELMQILKVSKALVSPALKELESEGLIERAASENSKVKRYRAREDVATVIKDVLKRREKPLLDKITKSHTELAGAIASSTKYKMDRFERMGAMIQMAQMWLLFLLEFDDLDQMVPTKEHSK